MLLYSIVWHGIDDIIKSTDTRVLIIMLGNTDYLNITTTLNISMEYGVGNKKGLINITQLVTALGPSMCKKLIRLPCSDWMRL